MRITCDTEEPMRPTRRARVCLSAGLAAAVGAAVGVMAFSGAPASAATPLVVGAATAEEGAVYSLTLGSTDPTDPMYFSIDWGDGTISVAVLRPSGTYTHVFADDPDGPSNAVIRTVTVGAFDSAGGTLIQVPVMVTNAEPRAALTGAATASVGSPYTVAVGPIVDPGRDTVVSRVLHWGDGTSQPVGGSGEFTHTYSAAGPMAVSLEVTDEDGTFTAGRLAVNSVVVAPTAPTALAAVAVNRSSVQLTWVNTTTTATTVEIERCKGATCTRFVRVKVLPGTSVSFVDSGLSGRTTYSYRVRARNAAGTSPYTATARVTTPR